MASLHTSLLPSTHGLYEPTKRMAPGLTTLAELLREAGYETLAVVSHVFVARKHGFDQGFERFDEEFVLGHDGVSSEGLTGRALELLDGRSGRPFFLWVHYFDPHFTYVGHADHAFGEGYDGPLSDHVEFAPLRDEADSFTDADVQHVVDLYDAEIAHTDRWIGALLDGARERTAGEQTVVLFTADHGEAFRERGFFGHGKYCYDELARVPLVLGGDLAPELRGRTSRAIVETASLPRTIAELCGLDGSTFRGTSVLAHLRAGEDGAGEPLARIETTYAWTDEDRRQAVVRGDWKLIRTQDDGSFELYHLGRDPGERTNLWGREDEDVRAAARDLLEQVSALPPLGEGRGGRVELADEDVEHLRALGYVDD